METKKQNKAKIKTAAVIGVCIVAVTAFVIAVAVLYPSFKAKSVLKDMTSAISVTTAVSATVYDPDEGKDLFNEGGIEHIANESERARLTELILKISDGAKYSARDAKDILFDFDYRIRLRSSSEKALDFFLSDGIFYITKDGVRYFFRAKNEVEYKELISFAKSLIESESP